VDVQELEEALTLIKVEYLSTLVKGKRANTYISNVITA
jgi:hypothetical protein